MIHPYPSELTLTHPEKFTNPFRYSPHPLAVLAAELLTNQIKDSVELSEMFAEGKMMGVLAVAYGAGYEQTGYLAAFSGLAGGKSTVDGFVPPIYDLTAPDGYFKIHEAEISSLNTEIAELSSSSKLHDLRLELKSASSEMESEIHEQKIRMARLKARRDDIRMAGVERSDDLVRQSQFEKAQLRRIKQTWEEKIRAIREQMEAIEDRISSMKRQRKNMSDQLQEWIFDQYRVHNYNGGEASVSEIFKSSGLAAPGGTGECAAPKLLEYAYRNDLKPLAMGEFWYGKSPQTAVRTQGRFYPSCTSKCGPLLGYMTQGLDIEQENIIHGSPEILYEDEDILAVDKPSGMPSVPGLNGTSSLLEWLTERTGCSTIESVHRLDMDTSGVMIFAKKPTAARHIRRQFEEHEVRKTYRAKLSPTNDNNIQEGEGGFISLPLSPDYDERPRQKADHHQGKEAITEYHVDKIHDDGGIEVTFWPTTGRTHQLRVHSAHNLGLGHPIMGDLLYGGANAPRLCLHAAEIRLIHPTTCQEVIFESSARF